MLRRQAEADQAVFAAVVGWRIDQRGGEAEAVKQLAGAHQ